MTTIRMKRLISTGPYENVEIEITEDVERDELREARKNYTQFIDEWELFARKHYIKRPENRGFQSNREPVEPKKNPTNRPPFSRPEKPRSIGKTANPETVKAAVKLKREEPKVYYEVDRIAKKRGYFDLTFMEPMAFHNLYSDVKKSMK